MSYSLTIRRKRRKPAEFIVYFSLLFTFALPFMTAAWVEAVAREGTLNLPGPLARAWVEAERVTQIIFSA